jgi:hypothetical protein
MTMQLELELHAYSQRRSTFLVQVVSPVKRIFSPYAELKAGHGGNGNAARLQGYRGHGERGEPRAI